VNDLTPAESEAVRRLLADARADEPLPADVAARLDGVLAGLTADRTPVDASAAAAPLPTDEDAAPAAPVIPLRRRRWPQVLVAAAAVTALAFGTTQLLRDSQGGDDAGAGADPASVDSDTAAESEADAQAPGELTGRSPAASKTGDPETADGVGGATAPQAFKDSLAALGVQRLVPLRPGPELDAAVKALVDETERGANSAYKVNRTLRACGPFYAVEGARFFVAAYRGHVALVLAHPDVEGRRLVEVYDCQGSTPRRTVELVTLTDGE